MQYLGVDCLDDDMLFFLKSESTGLIHNIYKRSLELQLILCMCSLLQRGLFPSWKNTISLIHTGLSVSTMVGMQQEVTSTL